MITRGALATYIIGIFPPFACRLEGMSRHTTSRDAIFQGRNITMYLLLFKLNLQKDLSAF